VFFEHHARCIKRFLRPAQGARGKRDLGFSNDALARATDCFRLKPR
jgi:hypothetical protein